MGWWLGAVMLLLQAGAMWLAYSIGRRDGRDRAKLEASLVATKTAGDLVELTNRRARELRIQEQAAANKIARADKLLAEAKAREATTADVETARAELEAMTHEVDK